MKDKMYDTDDLMREVWVNLARDFRLSTYGTLCMEQERVLRLSPAEFRDVSFPDKFSAPPYIFKAQYQLENLFKRYRFRVDKFTEDELRDRTLQKFWAVQERISAPLPDTPLIHMVLAEARRIIKSVLGSFDQSELHDACRMSTKATLGNPLHKSYLDIKVGGKITGSTEQIKWFRNEYLPNDTLLREVIEQRSSSEEPIYEVCDTLNATLVPKSYKSLRLILPNTLIGAFRSAGIGKMIQRRLLNVGLDITKLQKVHGGLIRQMSKNRRLVTADLSGASDSPSFELMVKVFPRAWFNEMNLGRISQVEIDDTKSSFNSFMTMGIGFTFPAETLLFYALLKAIARLSRVRGRISVYGDDLIYPRELHKYVKVIFPSLHLNLNKDKTYVNSYFRESCGSDSYRGVDVRPFNPEGRHQILGRKPYVLLLYKICNGLQKRWNLLEIPSTMKFLLAEILLVEGFVVQVPPSFPDVAGLKTQSISKEEFFLPVVFCKERQCWSFPYYRLESRDRVVLNELPYYWEALRSSYLSEDEPYEDPYAFTCTMNRSFYFGAKQHKEFLSRYTEFLDVFRWVRQQPQPKNYRSPLTGKRLKKLLAAVASKTETKVKRSSATTSVWT